MSTYLDTRLVPRVKALIARVGLSATFDTSSDYEYDPATGIGEHNTPATTSWKITPPDRYTSEEIDGDLICEGDARTYLAAEAITFTPVPGMTVTISSEVWHIQAVNTIRTGEDIALYELQLRR